MRTVKFLSAHSKVHSVDFSNPEIELTVSWGMNPSFSKKIPKPRFEFLKEPKIFRILYNFNYSVLFV